MKIVKELSQSLDQMASWRQFLHQNPEIAYQENNTANFIRTKLESFGIDVHTGIGGTGVVGVISGKKKINKEK